MRAVKWIPTELDPHHMIAEPTLQAVRALLQDASGGVTAPVSVPLENYPVLAEVGGVVRVESLGVGVARISRTSFVAFEMAVDGMHEVPVQLDQAGGTLTITPRSAPA